MEGSLMNGGSLLEKKGRWSCLPHLGSDQREAAKEDPEGEPPADPEEGCLEDPLPVVALGRGRIRTRSGWVIGVCLGNVFQKRKWKVIIV